MRHAILIAAIGVLVGALTMANTALAAPQAGAPPLRPRDWFWAGLYDGPGDGDNFATAMGASPDGSRVYVTGHSDSVSSSWDFATVAYDAVTGVELWVARYDSSAHDFDWATALGVSPDGTRVYVTGYSYVGLSASYDYATVAYEAATGARVWTARYNGPVNGWDFASAMVVSPDGSRVYVTGNSNGGSSSYDYSTVALATATGALLWVARYDGPANGDDVPSALGISPDGSSIYVSGISYQASSSHDIATVAYDASTGAQLWTARYQGPATDFDAAFATSLGLSPDGSRVYVTGHSFGGSSSSDDYATMAYDAGTGTRRWAARYNGPGNGSDFTFGLGVSPDGSRVFVTGYSYGGSSFDDYATVSYNAATGAELWTARYRGPANGTDVALGLGVNPQGTRVYVTGYSSGGNASYAWATVAYDASTGDVAWSHREPGRLGFDVPWDVVVSPDGTSVFVTGSHQVSPDGQIDYGTIAYAS